MSDEAKGAMQYLNVTGEVRILTNPMEDEFTIELVDASSGSVTLSLDDANRLVMLMQTAVHQAEQDRKARKTGRIVGI